MPIFVKCLLTVLCLVPIGVFLRICCSNLLGYRINWTKDGAKAIPLIWKRNAFVAFLLCFEGIISNAALIGFIVGIPLYFLKGV